MGVSCAAGDQSPVLVFHKRGVAYSGWQGDGFLGAGVAVLNKREIATLHITARVGHTIVIGPCSILTTQIGALDRGHGRHTSSNGDRQAQGHENSKGMNHDEWLVRLVGEVGFEK